MMNYAATIVTPAPAAGTQPRLDWDTPAATATAVACDFAPLDSQYEWQVFGEITARRYHVQTGPEFALHTNQKITITSSRNTGRMPALTGSWRVVQTPVRNAAGWLGIVEAW